MFYNFTNNLWQVSGGFSQVGENFNPEVGFLPRRGYRRPEFRAFFSAAAEEDGSGFGAFRRTSPTTSFYGLDGELQTEAWHIHAFEIQPRQGGRFGWFVDYNKDNPTAPFTVFNRDGRRVVIPAGQYSVVAERASSTSTTRARASPARSATASATTTTATSTRSS